MNTPSIRLAALAMCVASLSLVGVQAHAGGSGHGGGHHSPKPPKHHPKPPKHPVPDDCGPTDPCDATTKLKFDTLLKVGKTLTQKDTVGGDLTVTASKNGLLVNALGQLGVSTPTSFLEAADIRLGKNESITFTFENAVELINWDFTDLPEMSNVFTLAIDGAAAVEYSLHSFNATTDLIGSKFTFGYKGDSYFIDSLTFQGYCPPVPEPETYGLALAGLLVAGVALRRGRKVA